MEHRGRPSPSPTEPRRPIPLREAPSGAPERGNGTFFRVLEPRRLAPPP